MQISSHMRTTISTLAVIPFVILGLNANAQLSKVKVKAFTDEVGVDHSPFVFNSVSVSDVGSIVALYPKLDAQPDWIEEKKNYVSPTAVHTWSREKAVRQVKNEPYLVYGRDQAEAQAVTRIGDKTYLIAYQDKSEGGSALVYSRLTGSGITASPCKELVKGELSMQLRERPSIEPKAGMYRGVYSENSASGEHALISVIGAIEMGGQKADIAMVCVDKDMTVQWTEAMQLTESGAQAEILDVAMLGENDAVVLVRVTKGSNEEMRLYRRSAKDFLLIDLEGDVLQDAEMMVQESTVNIAGTYGHAEDRQNRTFGGFHMKIDGEALNLISYNTDKFSEPAKNTLLAGADFTEDGKCYVTTATYMFEGTKSGSGGAELKNVKYHCTNLHIFHFYNDGSHARTTLFPMANTGRSAFEVIPATMTFNGDLLLFYNEDPANADLRKKGKEMDPEDADENEGVQYTQLNFKGEKYSRMFIKEDDEVRSIFPFRSWELGKGELFLMGVVNNKNPVFYPIKIEVKAGTT